MDVDALIKRAKAGDAHAFNRLVESHQTLAFNVARQHLSDEDALDACQDAMLKAWNAISRFQGNAVAFKSWLLHVVVNSCRDRGRYVNRRPSVPIEVERDGETYVLPLPDPGQTPDEYAMVGDLGRLLEWAIGHLPEEQRTVVVLDHVGFSYAEIAETLDIKNGTVKSRLNRARVMLRDILRDERGRHLRAELNSGEPDGDELISGEPNNSEREVEPTERSQRSQEIP